jgi:hypothetical protein
MDFGDDDLRIWDLLGDISQTWTKNTKNSIYFGKDFHAWGGPMGNTSSHMTPLLHGSDKNYMFF